jgi:hypothetical protein
MDIMLPAFSSVEYEGTCAQTSWSGISLEECSELDSFMRDKVADRLNDAEGRTEFRGHLRGLALTDFGKASLEAVLEAEVPEERDWAVGEALAEALLTATHGVQWPWNMERDKRHPNASLPGADIVGFIPSGPSFRLALGEVKTSAESTFPPQVMYGRSGLVHQIDTLATNLEIIYQLLKWLLPRCKGTSFENAFNCAAEEYLNSGNRAATLFGILIRETSANEMDLKARGTSLGAKLFAPASCILVAVYLPHKISELPVRAKRGSRS